MKTLKKPLVKKSIWSRLAWYLSSMLKTDGGKDAWSSARFTFVFTVLLSNIIIFVALAVLLIKESKFPDVPEGVLWLYGVANGISFAGKVSQKFRETKTPTEEVEVVEHLTEETPNEKEE